VGVAVGVAVSVAVGAGVNVAASASVSVADGAGVNVGVAVDVLAPVATTEFAGPAPVAARVPRLAGWPHRNIPETSARMKALRSA
jgi:hypothetical protein